MAFLVFLTLLIPGVTHSGQKKNVWFNFNLLVLCDSVQISILDKALWHVLEKNVCFPDSWWNVLDCIVVHVLWVWYWVTDLEGLSPVEITSLNFFLLSFPFRFISVYFTHWILWCWVHTELCLPIELTLPSFNTVFTSCEGFHTTVCFVWCKCGHPSCVWLPLAWNKCLVLFLVCVVWDLQPVFVHSI